MQRRDFLDAKVAVGHAAPVQRQPGAGGPHHMPGPEHLSIGRDDVASIGALLERRDMDALAARNIRLAQETGQQVRRSAPGIAAPGVIHQHDIVGQVQ